MTKPLSLGVSKRRKIRKCHACKRRVGYQYNPDTYETRLEKHEETPGGKPCAGSGELVREYR